MQLNMKLSKQLKRAYERDRMLWQAGTAVIAGSVILAGVALFAPRALPQETEPATVAAPVAAPNAYKDVRLEGRAAIVYDLKTGETLWTKNEEAQLPLASLTKLLTVYAAADVLGDTSPVLLTASAMAAEGESGLMEGETFAFRDAARLALVASSNDAAAAIAEAAQKKKGVAGSALMASAAQAAHLTQTYAVNGTGLDEDERVSGGYGSAKDVALLAGELIRKKPALARATTENSVTVTSLEGVPHTLRNTNQEAVTVPGALLSKTGFTDLAGGNLVVVFDAGFDHPVAVVVLGSSREGRFADVSELIEATHAHFARTTP